jgi:hypothetical protein
LKRRDEETTGRYFLSQAEEKSRGRDTHRPQSSVQEVPNLPVGMDGQVAWLCRQHYGVAHHVDNMVEAIGALPEAPTKQTPFGRPGKGLLNDVFFIKADVAQIKEGQADAKGRLSLLEAAIDLNTQAVKSSSRFQKIVGVVAGILITAAGIVGSAYKAGYFDEPPIIPPEFQVTK